MCRQGFYLRDAAQRHRDGNHRQRACFLHRAKRRQFQPRAHVQLSWASCRNRKVNTLNGKFDVDRFFCLTGTNPKDYAVAAGWSARLVGPFSDGLVRTDNATVFDGDEGKGTSKLAPRAFVYRSHSGYYGIVNSEEGYQNLRRFLFGNIRIDGSLEVRDITLPADVEQARKAGQQVRASYQFEVVARVRGAH